MALKEKTGSHDLAHEGAVPVSRALPAMEFHLLTCKHDASEIHCGQAVNGNLLIILSGFIIRHNVVFY